MLCVSLQHEFPEMVLFKGSAVQSREAESTRADDDASIWCIQLMHLMEWNRVGSRVRETDRTVSEPKVNHEKSTRNRPRLRFGYACFPCLAWERVERNRVNRFFTVTIICTHAANGFEKQKPG